MNYFAEPFALGFSSGLSCATSCGAVLAPWLASSDRGPAGTAGLLVGFLGGRLAGYLLFAVAAWGLGSLAPPSLLRDPRALGWVNLALAALLAVAAGRGLAGREGACPAARRGALRSKLGLAGTAALGVLTGFGLCPPFLAATVRVAQSPSLGGALLFFALFFLGTTVWFIPFAASGWLRRWPQVPVVARMTMALLAAYYAYRGVALFLLRGSHA